jgi:probable F420-dependent oxidoreductase
MWIIMKVGIRLPQTGKHAKLENVIRLAEAADKSGFDSLWVLERLLWPISPLTPHPATPSGIFPEDWQNVLDPLELLSFVAAITKKIFLGTSVIDMFFHNPVVLAKRFATLDVLSGGRALAGLGIGWSKDEYVASNIPFKQKRMRADEFIRLLKQIWSEQTIKFNGQFYTIPLSIIAPKPMQKPQLPLYLGGSSPDTFSRMAKYAHGWIGVVRNDLRQLQGTLDLLKRKVVEAHRNVNDFEIIVIIYPNVAERRNEVENRFDFTGTIRQVGNNIGRLKKMGVGHIILNYNRSLIEDDMDAVIDISKTLMTYAR